MTLLRVLHAEALKMRHTIAWKMAVLAPGIVVMLAFFAAWQAPFSTISRFGPGQDWAALTRFCMRLWAILMLPLYIVLQSALLAGLDHAGGQWRSILARPLPRWTFYATKLTFVIGLAVSGSALFALGIGIDGAILPHLQREVVFASPIPWGMILRNCADVFGLAFAGLTIQKPLRERLHQQSVYLLSRRGFPGTSRVEPPQLAPLLREGNAKAADMARRLPLQGCLMMACVNTPNRDAGINVPNEAGA